MTETNLNASLDNCRKENSDCIADTFFFDNTNFCVTALTFANMYKFLTSKRSGKIFVVSGNSPSSSVGGFQGESLEAVLGHKLATVSPSLYHDDCVS